MSRHVDEEMMMGGDIVAPDLNAKDAPPQQVEKIARIHTSGADSDTIHIGDQVVSKHELVEAFRSVLKPADQPVQTRQFGNPAPIGLCGFALTTFVLSLVNIHARHVTVPHIVIGLAFFYGGAVQILAGMWEIACGNTFGAVAFASYGGFWLSYGAIFVDSFGILAAYEGTDSLGSALGFYLTGWFIFTTLMCLATLRTTVANFALFFCLSITFLLLASAEYTAKVGVAKAGGWFGLITSFIAWYVAYKAIANRENTFVLVRDFKMPGSKKYE
ncbi:ammonia transport outward protein 2 [Trichomonascus vanleenenianus]|uniref:Ady2p n=1 Tax=Trichomonascus vanleenenianus TaxID=2268995 RepID=UPI003EC9D3B3